MGSSTLRGRIESSEKLFNPKKKKIKWKKKQELKLGKFKLEIS